MSRKHEDVAHALLERHGRTYASEAGITLRDTPQPLYQVLVLSHLLSARIKAGIAVASARALFDAGMRDARRMAEATWQQRVDALGKGGYRRYDERTSTQLGDGAELLRDRYGGDLRRVREAGKSEVPGLLREFPGIGPSGVDIFLREVQGLWPEFAPYFGAKAQDGAEKLGLPRSVDRLARLASGPDLPRLAAGLVRVALDDEAGAEVRELAGAGAGAR
ncbi:endonuclease [Streptomyces armeniacus]|uniref:Endonuclease n=1 Tax=Streptomyces armeniacus TaxID=83291 RepID=A0A345XNV5_9ACTN|nr:endonuclease [Streptomyces armeniacus]AXK33321.1 endonuclease [Streptomyces armeniacus]